MVDVTILLYLPLNTSLDDLSFLAEWGVTIVGQVEEKMILAGKSARYIRHRVLPIMYKAETDEKPKVDLTGNTNPWKDLATKKQKFQNKIDLPSWVKHTTISSSEESELDEDDSIDDSCCVGTIGFAKKGEAFVKQTPDKKCPGYLSFVETIKQAVDFNKNNCGFSLVPTASSDSESDSMYSDNSQNTQNSRNSQNTANSVNSLNTTQNIVNITEATQNLKINEKSQNSGKKAFSGQFSGTWAHKNSAETSPNGSISGETYCSKYSEKSSDFGDKSESKSSSKTSSKFSTKSSKLSFSHSNASKLSKRSSFSTTSSKNTSKHVILSLATGYDRDTLREVRQIVNDKTGVSILPVGLGDRGMIGLGGYYIKRLGDIKKLEDQIVNRLTGLC